MRYIIFLLLLSSLAHAQPVKLWDKTIGGNFFADDLYAMTPTADGGWLLAGNTSSDPTGDKTTPLRGAIDFWIVRLDAAGAILWDRDYGGKADDELRAVLPTADGGFLLGGYSGSGADGDKTTASRGNDDYWVVRIDAAGNKLWDKAFGTESSEQLIALVGTADDGFLLAGYSGGGADGDKTQPSRGKADYWVVRINASGAKLWDKAFGGDQNDALTAAAASPDGGILLAGYSYSEAGGDKSEPPRGMGDYWLVRLDATGNKLWDKTFGGSGGDALFTVAPTPGGGFIVGGQSASGAGGDRTEASRGLEDYWAVAIAADGTKLWDKAVGGPNYDRLSAIGLTADGGYLFGGWSGGGVGGDKTAPNKGGDDFWLVRLGPPARPLQLRNLLTRATTQGQANGEIRLMPFGGFAPYQYSIDDGATWRAGRIFKNLAAKTYKTAVRDASGAIVKTAVLLR